MLSRTFFASPVFYHFYPLMFYVENRTTELLVTIFLHTLVKKISEFYVVSGKLSPETEL